MGSDEVLAQALIEARRLHVPLAMPDGADVPGAEEAYRVQDLLLARLGAIAGWKLLVTPGAAACRGSPQPQSQVFPSPASVQRSDFFAPKLEVEIAVRFGADLPARAEPYVESEVRDAVAALHCAFEILDTRYDTGAERSVHDRLADLQSNGGIVSGDGQTDWQEIRFEEVDMELWADGKIIRECRGGPKTEDVMSSLTWLANHAARRTGGLRAGQVVITGAPNMKAAEMVAGIRYEARCAGLGSAILNVT